MLDPLHESYLDLFYQFRRIIEKIDFFGISKGEFLILVHMKEKNDQGEVVTIRNLADMLRVTSPAISRMIGQMVKDGLVEKKMMPEDRRNNCLFVTKKGSEVLRCCEDRFERIAEKLRAIYGEKRTSQFAVMCRDFLNTLEQMLSEEQNSQGDGLYPGLSNEFVKIHEKQLTNGKNMV